MYLKVVLVQDEGRGLGTHKNRFNPQSWFPRSGILSPDHPEYTVSHWPMTTPTVGPKAMAGIGN